MSVMCIRATEVLASDRALRAFHTTGLALEIPPQSIPKGQYLPLFSSFMKIERF